MNKINVDINFYYDKIKEVSNKHSKGCENTQ